ncbi:MULTISPECIES: putative entry exclusion protein TrbK-alt [Sphingomonadales]|uniref:Conjugal transfer protein TrbK n=1 Tax=Sphingobium ummariense RL-3 TaxID=1346791 RepID=T0J7F4_9SPHN|nr:MULTISPECIES: putative entry exclusion protein TrbK-alt [Sphingomonadaceae]EQB33911.1 hypothetical protein M529_02550 [Sphingobium ummariense RL-3]WOF45915.1 putative entry exclusion protein TrbK-alt [Sphingopyxis indica]
MEGKTTARIAAAIFVGFAIAASLIQLSRKEESPIAARPAPVVVPSDPLAQTLRHCRDMGIAAERDPVCLDAWATNRERFLGHTPKPRQAPAAHPPASMFPSEDEASLSKESAPAPLPEQ